MGVSCEWRRVLIQLGDVAWSCSPRAHTLQCCRVTCTGGAGFCLLVSLVLAPSQARGSVLWLWRCGSVWGDVKTTPYFGHQIEFRNNSFSRFKLSLRWILEKEILCCEVIFMSTGLSSRGYCSWGFPFGHNPLQHLIEMRKDGYKKIYYLHWLYSMISSFFPARVRLAIQMVCKKYQEKVRWGEGKVTSANLFILCLTSCSCKCPSSRGRHHNPTRAAVPAAGYPSLSPGGQEPMEHEPGHPVPRPGGAPPASPAKGASSSPEGILAFLPPGIMETVAINGWWINGYTKI